MWKSMNVPPPFFGLVPLYFSCVVDGRGSVLFVCVCVCVYMSWGGSAWSSILCAERLWLTYVLLYIFF